MQLRAAAFGVSLGLVLTFGAATASAQDAYPSRPIRLVVDTSPGGITDILARLAADGVSARVGQPVIVDNKPGASGDVAVDFVVKAPADGYTLLICAGGNLVIKPFLGRTLTYDPINDLVPVFNVAEAPHILVVPATLPAKNLAEFIAYARANPGKIYYGSAGTGSPPHLAVALFAKLAGAELVHVPYKGVGPALPDLIAGRLQVMSMSLGSARPYLKSGALRALAAGSKRRLAGLPDVPTSAEAGLPGWEMTTWFGIFAPKGTSAEVVRLVNAGMQAVIDDPRTRKRMLDSGMEPIGGSAEAFAERVRSDYRAWEQVVKASRVKLD